ncbi:uncharacterized protein LOC121994758 [Zingiber officinale]|nr:uncharacterized protein LOC121994758 [Zingiber officinale]
MATGPPPDATAFSPQRGSSISGKGFVINLSTCISCEAESPLKCCSKRIDRNGWNGTTAACSFFSDGDSRRRAVCTNNNKRRVSAAAATSSPRLLSYLHRNHPMLPRNCRYGGGGLTSSSSRRDVLYCCGHCGYALNLSSSDRDTANIGAEYGRFIKKGVVSFATIDESRFTQTDDLRCLPYFRSPRSWGIRRRRTRLLCRGCGLLIGVATYAGDEFAASSPSGGSSSEGNDAETTSGSFRKYKIRIGALQPSDDDAAAPFFT